MRNRSCHGDPSVFSFSSLTCTSCPSFDSCVSSTHNSLLQMNVGAPVTLLLERHVRFDAYKSDKVARASVITGKRAITQDEEVTAKRLPVKTASQYRRLVTEGFIPLMKQGLAQQRNPFKVDGYKYLNVAFDALLAGGFSKKDLRLVYMDSCTWSEGTAFSAVSMIWHLFVVCGIAEENEGVLRPLKGN